MADSPQRTQHQRQDSSQDRRRGSESESDSLLQPKVDSSSDGPDEIYEDGNEESDGEGVTGETDGEESWRLRLRRQIPRRDMMNMSKTPSPSKMQRISSINQRDQKFLGGTKQEKSFEDFVKVDENRGVFKPKDEKKKISIDDFQKKPRSSEAKKNEWPTLTTTNLIVVALVGMCVFFGLWLYLQQEDNSLTGAMSLGSSGMGPGGMWRKLQKSLLRKFKQINSKYTHQLSATGIHLLSAVNSTFDVEEPRQPSAITLLIPPSLQSSAFPKCFAMNYASAVNEMYAEVMSDTFDQQKVKVVDREYFRVYGENITGIHEDLKNYFSVGGKVVVVEDVDKLEKEEHFLVFHSFCDNFKAPHKRATFMFLLNVPNSVANKYTWDYSQAADISYSALHEAWTSTVSQDHRAAMIARVAATAVLLKDGDSC